MPRPEYMRSAAGDGPARILILDPDAATRALLERTVRSYLPGLAPESVPSLGDDAPPINADLVLCSAAESRRDRLDTLERILRIVPGAPVLVLIPGEAQDSIDDCLRLGALSVLIKAPGYLDQLPGAIRSALAAAHARRCAAERETSLAREAALLRDRLRALEAEVVTDPLTGLLNRRGIDQRLEQIVASAARRKEDLSVLMIDLDGLKYVNDALGHGVGDDLLRSAGACIREQCRLADIAGRSGGDEFVVVLPGTSADRATNLADRIRRRFRELVKPLQARLDEARGAQGVVHVIGRAGRIEGTLSMTIGIASLGSGATTTGPGLIVRADDAMYAGKRAGRDRIVVFAPGAGERALAA